MSKAPLVLVCGPWGSGTSACCSILSEIGVNTPGPFFQVRDPLTPNCYEMNAFRNVVLNLVDEMTLKLLRPNSEIEKVLQAFQLEHFPSSETLSLLKCPASSALLPYMHSIFSLKTIIVLRDAESIERSRVRRNWPAQYGSIGASKIYAQLLDSISTIDLPYLFVRHRDIINPQRCFKLVDVLARYLSLNPSSIQRRLAVQSISR